MATPQTSPTTVSANGARNSLPPFRRRAFGAGSVRVAVLVALGTVALQGWVADEAKANPTGGVAVAGTGTISTPSAGTTVIHQQSHSLALDWSSFDVAAGEKVIFRQPSAAASALNRVLSHLPSNINGSIQANGRVFLINPNGIVFGKTSRVNVGALFASSLDISTADFMAGRYEFAAPDGTTPGYVINRGIIQAASGGSVSLVGGQVKNEGLIVAELGHVNMAAGRKALVDFDGDGLIRFEIDDKVLENTEGVADAVSNTGEIIANGGQVFLTADVAKDVFTRAVNSEGVIRAGRIDKSGGRIMLAGLGGTVRNAGTLDASGGEGGDVSITSDVAAEQLGMVTADASSGDAGSVVVESAGTTMLGAASVTSASSDAAAGGSVRLLGERVGLEGGAKVAASGASAGGEILVGGDLQGKNDSVRNATATFVGSGATLNADATADGDGGKVIVWADDVTRSFGDITTRGAGGGQGGFVETSGKRYLEIGGSVDAGRGGTWLLDPENVEITGATANVVPPGAVGDPGPAVFTPTADDTPTTIDVALINTALGNGSDVEINTSSTGTTTLGNITVTSAISKIADGGSTDGSTLTLNADNDIFINNTIGSTTGILNVVLNAGLTTGGAIDINNAITTNGGDFTSVGTTFDNTGGTITTAGGNASLAGHTGTVTIGADVNTGTGTLSLPAALTLGANITTSGTAVSLGTVTLVNDADVTVTTGGADITSANITGDSTAGNETLTLVAGAGNVTLGSVFGNGTASDADGLADVTVTSGNVATLAGGNLTGTLALASATTTALTGDLTVGTLTLPSTLLLGGDITTNATAVSLGTVTLVNDADVTVTTGGADITSANITGDSTAGNETLTLVAGAGNVTLGSVFGNGTASDADGLADVTVTSGNVATLAGGNLTGTLALASATTTALTDDLTVGTLTLPSTLLLGGDITTNATAVSLGTVTLVNDADVTVTTGGADITSANITGDSTAGNETLTLVAGAGNVTLGSVFGNGTSSEAAGLVDVTVTSGNVATLAGGNLTGTLALASATTTALTDDLTVGTLTLPSTLLLGGDITTNATAVSLGTVTLVNDADVTVTSGGANISSGNIAGDSGVGTETLALVAGAGNVTLGSVFGNGTSSEAAGLVDVTVTSGNVATLAGGNLTGTLALGTVSTASVTGNLTANALTVLGTVGNVSLAGTGGNITSAVTFANTGTLDLGAGGGTQVYDGGLNTASVGGVTTLNGTLTTSGDTMALGDITMGSDLTLDTGGGSITIGVLTGGDNDLTLAAGIAAGTTTVSGAVSGLGDNSGAALTIASGVTGLVNLDSTVAGDGWLVAVGTDSNVRLGGNVDMENATGTGGTNLAGNVTLDNSITFDGFDGVTFGNVTLDGAGETSITTNNGDLTFTGTVDGNATRAEALRMTAGSGDILFDGSLGATTELGNVTIVSAGVTSLLKSFQANSLTQQAGSGDTFIGGNATTGGQGAMVLAGIGVTNALDITLSARLRIFDAITATTGDIVLNTGNDDIVVSVANLTPDPDPPVPDVTYRDVLAATGNIIITLTGPTTGAGGNVLLNDFDAGGGGSTGNATVPTDGLLSRLRAATGSILISDDNARVVEGTYIDNALFPQIVSQTRISDQTAATTALYLGNDANPGPLGAGEAYLSDVQMDALLLGSSRLRILADADVVLDRSAAFDIGSGDKSFDLVTTGSITDVDVGFAFQSTGAAVPASETLTLAVGAGQTIGAGGDGTLSINVPSLRIAGARLGVAGELAVVINPAAIGDVSVTNAPAAGAATYRADNITGTPVVTVVQSSGNALIAANNFNIAGGTLNLTASAGTITAAGATAAEGVITSDTLITSSSGLTTLDSDNVINTYSGNSTGNITLVDSGGGLVVDGISTTGNVSLTTSGGALTQTDIIDVDGTTTLDATGQTITLGNTSNDFGTVELTAATATLEDVNGIILGNSALTTSLSVTANGTGDITQSGNVTGGTTTTLVADGDSITLGNASNDFDTVLLTATNATLQDVGGIELGAGNVTGTLSVTANNSGGITQSGTLVGNSTATFTAVGDTITLADASNEFASVALNAGNATVQDADNFVLGAGNVTGNLAVTANGTGNITQSGAVTGNAAAVLTAAGGNITLGNTGNNFSSVRMTAGNATLVDADDIAIGPSTTNVTGNLSVRSVAGNISNTGPITGDSAATFTADNGFSIAVDNPSNDFNTVSFLAFSGQLLDVAVADTAGGLALAGLSATGNLTAATTNDAITQTGALVVGGTSSFTSGAADTTLGNTSNNFGTVALTAANATVIDANDIDIGVSAVGGTLDVTSLAGNISNSGAITGASIATFTAGSGRSIAVDSAGNNFTSATFVASAGTLLDVAVFDGAGGLALGGLTVTGNLSAATSDDAITQTGALIAGGTSSFTSGTASTTLADPTNDFGTLEVTASSATVQDVNNIVLGNSAVTGTLSVTAGAGGGAGNITQSGAVTGGSAATLVAAGDTITLGNTSNNFASVAMTADNATVADTDAIVIAATTVAANLAVSAGGAITQSAALSVPGTATLSAAGSAITLNNTSNDFGSAVLLTAATSSIADNNDIVLGTSAVTTTLQVTAGAGGGVGNITQNGPVTGNSAATLVAAGDAITLGNTSNDFGSVLMTAANATVVDANDIAIGTTAVTGNLSVRSVAGNISNTGAITGNSAATFTAGSGGSIAVDNASNDFNTVNFVASSGRLLDVAVADTAGGLVLAGVSATGNLTATTTNDDITQTGDLVVDGTSTFTSGTANTTLDRVGNDFGTVLVNAGDATLDDANTIELGTTTVTGNLTVTANGAGSIIQSGVVTAPTATFVAAANTIALGNSSNDFGTVSLTAGTATVVDANNLEFGNSSVTVSLTAVAGGAGDITQAAGSSVTGNSTATLNADGDAIRLDETTNNFNTVNLTAATGNIADTNSIVIGTSTLATSLEVVTRAGGGGNINTAAAGAAVTTPDLTLNADGGIGNLRAFQSADTTATYSLTSDGASPGGDISLSHTGDLSTSAFTALDTRDTDGQTATIAASGAITYDLDLTTGATFLDANDTLILDGTSTAWNTDITGGAEVRFGGVTTLGANRSATVSRLVFGGAVAGAGRTLTVNGATTLNGDVTASTVNLDSVSVNSDSIIQTDNLTFAGPVTGTRTLTIIPQTDLKDIDVGGGADTLLGATTLASINNSYAGNLNIGGKSDGSTATTAGNVTVSGNLTLLGADSQVVVISEGDVLFDGDAGGKIVAPVIAVLAAGTDSATGFIRDTNSGPSASPATPKVLQASKDLVLIANIQAGENNTGGGKLNVNAANVDIRQFNSFEGVENERFSFTADTTALGDELVAAAQAGLFGPFTNRNNLANVGAGFSVVVTGLETTGLGELGFIDEGLFLLPSLVTQLEVATKQPWYARVGDSLPPMPDDPEDDEAWAEFIATVTEILLAEGEKESGVEKQIGEMMAYREGLKNAFALPGGDLLPVPDGGVPELDLPDLPSMPALPEPSAYSAPVGESWQEGGLGVERGWWSVPGGAWPRSFG